MNTPIIGIDLGTTNSVVACITEGKTRIIPVDGASTMPSCVGLAPDGTLLVGTPALRQYSVYPERTIKSIKRKMGLDIKVSLGEQSFTPEQVSALILSKLKVAAEKFLKVPVNRAVITVPAYFNERQRQATRTAGELAGLTVERILNEPTAAALAYAAQGGVCRQVLVYDLGGGTFDVSLVTNENGVMEVKSSHGDTSLGGDDFDELLVEEAAGKFADLNNNDPLENPRSHNRLREIMEKAKIQLSDMPFTTVEEALFHDGKNLSLECSRMDYEELISPLIETTIECCQKCLSDAGLRPSQLDLILLAGGASRTPMVYNLIENYFGIQPRHEINPDLIVAMGAALQAGQIDGVFTSSILVDITPHDLGILALQGPERILAFHPIIRRNTPLPATKSEVYYTSVEGQESVIIEVYQGVSADYFKNEHLGNLDINSLDPKAPQGSNLVVKFSLNLNGMLEVVATEKHTGMSKVALLNTSQAVLAEDMSKLHSTLVPFKQTSDFSQFLEESDFIDLIGTQALIARARVLANSGDLNQEDLAELKELTDSLANAFKDKNAKSIAELTQLIEDLLFYLEE